MPKKIGLPLLFLIGLAMGALFAVTPGHADFDCTDPDCGNRFPYNIDTFDTFLDNGCNLFNPPGGEVCKPNPDLDLANPTGIYGVTVVANEANARIQIILLKDGVEESVLFEKPAYASEGYDGDSTECQQYGVWKEVNFDAGESLLFKNLTNGKESTIPLSNTPHSDCEGGDFTSPCELAQDSNEIAYISPPQVLEEGYFLVGWEDLADCDKADFIFAMRRVAIADAEPPVTISSACVEFGEIGAGKLYLRIPRVDGTCDVDLDSLKFYLNDPDCVSTVPCGDGVPPAGGCNYGTAVNDCDEDLPGPCVDTDELNNTICAQPNNACNECFNYRVGSPTCTDYRTSSGIRIKCCVLENGQTCPWKKCCKKRQLDDPKCQP